MTTAQLLDQNVIRCKSPRQAIKYLLRHWSAVQSDPAAFAGWAVHYCHALYALTPKERKKQLEFEMQKWLDAKRKRIEASIDSEIEMDRLRLSNERISEFNRRKKQANQTMSFL